jgi:excisionase family DNA binding protein
LTHRKRSGDGLTTAEAARRVGVSVATLKRWAEAGLLPCTRTGGGHRRFSAAAVDLLVARQGRGQQGLSTWVERVLGGAPLELEREIFEARTAHGAWWSVADDLLEVVAEMTRRRRNSQLHVLQARIASRRLARAVDRWAKGLPALPEAPRLLLASLTSSEGEAALSLFGLCAAERGWETWIAGPVRASELASPFADEQRPSATVVYHSPEEELELDSMIPSAISTVFEASKIPLAFASDPGSASEIGFTRTLRTGRDLRTWLLDVEASLGIRRD